MRKWIWILLLGLMLCGCKKNTPVKPVTTGLSFTAEINYCGNAYTCDCTAKRDGTVTVRVCEPEDLTGMTFTLQNGRVTAGYKGLTYTPDTEHLPLGSAVRLLDEILKTDRTATGSNGNRTVYGTIENHPFTLTVSPDGLPLYADVPDLGWAVSFRGVVLLP